MLLRFESLWIPAKAPGMVKAPLQARDPPGLWRTRCGMMWDVGADVAGLQLCEGPKLFAKAGPGVMPQMTSPYYLPSNAASWHGRVFESGVIWVGL